MPRLNKSVRKDFQKVLKKVRDFRFKYANAFPSNARVAFNSLYGDIQAPLNRLSNENIDQLFGELFNFLPLIEGTCSFAGLLTGKTAESRGFFNVLQGSTDNLLVKEFAKELGLDGSNLPTVEPASLPPSLMDLNQLSDNYEQCSRKRLAERGMGIRLLAEQCSDMLAKRAEYADAVQTATQEKKLELQLLKAAHAHQLSLDSIANKASDEYKAIQQEINELKTQMQICSHSEAKQEDGYLGELQAKTSVLQGHLRDLEIVQQTTGAEKHSFQEVVDSIRELKERIGKVEQDVENAFKAIETLNAEQQRTARRLSLHAKELANMNSLQQHQKKEMEEMRARQRDLSVETVVEQVLTQEEVSKLNDVIFIDHSGQEHESLFLPVRAQRQFGDSGHPGRNGYNARPIDIALKYYPNRGEGVVKAFNPQYMTAPYGYLPVSKLNDCKLFLKATGSNGQHGEPGGVGRPGQNGRNGIDATKRSAGTNGTNGTDGGNGGHGGRGGDAGDGANITLMIQSDQDLETLILLEYPVATHAGQPGVGGPGGKGGPGGRGGSGGAGCRYYTDEGSKYMPGGQDGQDGQDGMDGRDGEHGHIGKNGEFTILYQGRRYSRRFELQVKDTLNVDITSPTGVIEPDIRCTLSGVELMNPTEMPTPPCETLVYLQSTQWTVSSPRDAYRFYDSVLPGQTHLVKPLGFTTIPVVAPPPNTRLQIDHALPYRAKLERMNKHYPLVTQQYSSTVIRYPLEAFLPVTTASFTQQGEALVTMRLINDSSQTLIGSQSALKQSGERRFIITLDVTAQSVNLGSTMTFHPEGSSAELVLDSATRVDVPALAPQSESYFSGGFSINPDEALVNPEGFYHVKASFQLESFHQPDVYHLVQTIEFPLQLSLPYQYNPKADFVLAINSATSTAQIHSWRNFAQSLGSDIMLWNVSLYDGMSYLQTRHQDGRSFLRDLPNKVLIVLDNPYVNTQRRVCNATDLVSTKEIFLAAQEGNAASYLISPKPIDMLSMVVPPMATSSRRKQTNKTDLINLLLTDEATGASNVPVVNDNPLYALSSAQGASTQNFPVGESKQEADPHNPFSNTTANPIYTLPILKSKGCFGGVQEKAIAKKANKIAKTLRLHLPHKQYIVQYAHAVRKQEKHTQLGHVEIRAGLSPITAKLAYRHCFAGTGQPIDVSMTPTSNPIDQFCALKLLPFNRKLELLSKHFSTDFIGILLRQVVLSDLADEQLVLRQKKLKGKWELDAAKFTLLVCLSKLTEFNFTPMASTQSGKEVLKDMLVKYKLLLNLHKSRNKIVSKMSSLLLQNIESRYFNGMEDNFKKAVVQLRKVFDGENNIKNARARRNKFSSTLSRPYIGKYTLSNDHDVSSRLTSQSFAKGADNQQEITKRSMFGEQGYKFSLFTDPGGRSEALRGLAEGEGHARAPAYSPALQG